LLLTISQRLLGTTEIILIHHTDCGMLTFPDDEFNESTRVEAGLRPRARLRRSLTWRRMSASRWAGCVPAPSSPTGSPFAASSLTSPPDGFTK
jgi:hypothetical protein